MPHCLVLVVPIVRMPLADAAPRQWRARDPRCPIPRWEADEAPPVRSTQMLSPNRQSRRAKNRHFDTPRTIRRVQPASCALAKHPTSVSVSAVDENRRLLAPLAHTHAAPTMLVHSLYIFDRSGRCMLHKDWNRPRNPLADTPGEDPRLLFGMLHSIRQVAERMSPSRCVDKGARMYASHAQSERWSQGA